MRVIATLTLLLFCLTLAVSTGYAKSNKVEWEPITDADWAIGEDTARGIVDAAIIFEKIRANDKKLQNSKCYRTIYRRIRIFSEEGRKWGDAIVPTIAEKQKIRGIYGRTVLRDGSEILLAEDHIFEKEAVKTSDTKIKQTSFSMPGVTDDCIVEYKMIIRTSGYSPQWIAQQDIAVMSAQLTWVIAQFKITKETADYYADYITPNYLWQNTYERPTVKQLPNIKKPESLFFDLGFIPPFETEPYTLPEASLKTKLFTYYGSQKPPTAYWGDESVDVDKNLKEFCKKDKKIKGIVAGFAGLSTEDEKIIAAYDWIQSNVHNLSYYDLWDPKKPGKKLKLKERRCVDDVIKRGYGYSGEIHKLFCDILRELNIDAKMAYACDRSEDLFVNRAKYWQFDRSLVVLPHSDGSYSYFAPGIAFATVDQIPWYIEGIPALVGGSSDFFINTPFSSSSKNVVTQHYKYKIDEELEVEGEFGARLKGHSARRLRMVVCDEDTADYNSLLVEEIEENYGDIEIDLVSYENLNDTKKPLVLKCSITQPDLVTTGSRILLKPCSFLQNAENPFVKDDRTLVILFNYAQQIKESADFTLPAGYTIEALPEDRTFSNPVGTCNVTWSAIGGHLAVYRTFTIDAPMMTVDGYPEVQELFEARSEFSKQVVLLNEASDSPSEVSSSESDQ